MPRVAAQVATAAAVAAAAAKPLALLGRARVWRYDSVAAVWAKYDNIAAAVLCVLAVSALLHWATAGRRDKEDP